ncbi:MAG TPA: amino acid permease [Steroidobacteraceae bacterium]|jgi:APA family basic amino acid/polyamine antiporter|nr:amino acid permease [Steroidobacteraceae bacterium]
MREADECAKLAAMYDASESGARPMAKPSLMRQLLAVRPVQAREQAGAERLKQTLSAWSLMSIGIGATIGTGIFVLTGTVAANQSGPAVTLSLLIAAFGSGLAALCYAEFAAFLPVPGSAYSYTYATLGEAIAWFIGWNLLLEYAISASAVAVSWSAYVVNLLSEVHIHLPATWVNAPLQESAGHLVATGAIVNLPAILIVGAMSALCYIGIRETAGATNVMVALKVGVIVVFVVAGLKYVDPGNWHPYIPRNTGTFGHFGWTGVLQGAGIIFFSYVGFDTASTTALEARNPQRDLPIGIIGTLVVSTVLYVAMAALITGMVPYFKLNDAEPVAVALDAHAGLAWLSVFLKLGIIAGMTSVILTSLLGQPRILLSMADDGLLPPAMSRCHPRFKTPHVATAVTGIGAALIAGVFPLDVLADLISMGILLAFVVVCIGVLVMRYTRPEVHRPFRVPAAWLLCPLGALVCAGMTYFLSNATWIRLVVWTAIGTAIYAFYGYKHSRLRS